MTALGFDFTNGFHDTANAVATSVSTRALSPRLAVLIASIANLAGAFVTTAVAKTVGKGIIDTNLATEQTRARGAGRRDRVEPAHLVVRPAVELVARADRRPDRRRARAVGRRAASSGTASAHNVVIPAIIVADASRSPPRFCSCSRIYWIFRWMTPGVANRTFRLGQLGSGTWVAFTHGANDAQKTMGVIALALFTNGSIDHFYIPTG